MAKNKKAKLSKDLILKEAVKFLDQNEIKVLSMRKIASQLNCGTMSIYNHIKDKDDLLFLIVDFSLAQIEIPENITDWKSDLQKLIIDVHKLMLQHFWIADLWLNTMPGPNRIKFMNAVLKILSSGNLDDEKIYRGYCAVTMHLVGFTQQEISYKRAMGSKVEEMARDFMHSIPTENTYLIQHIEKRIARTLDDQDFEYVLDLLLDGLEKNS